MNTDTPKKTSVELRELAESLMKQAEEQSLREFESTMNFLSDKLTHMGRTKRDAVIHLVKMMRSHEEEATLAELMASTTRGRARGRADHDSQGNPPQVGATYRLPTGETWFKKGKVGATKREFAAHAKSTTWVEMRA